MRDDEGSNQQSQKNRSHSSLPIGCAAALLFQFIECALVNECYQSVFGNRTTPGLATLLRACAKITWQNARSGSDQCSIPNAQFSAEVDVGLQVVRSVRIRIEHWELNIGQILGLMSSSEYCQVIFARALRRGIRFR